MAIPNGTTESYDMSNSIREDLEDVIWDLAPMETWCVTNLDKVKAEGTKHEWLMDTLEAATVNTALDGDDAVLATINQPSRRFNYCQISVKAFSISGTVEATTMAGRKSEVSRAGIRKMKELKRDIEKALVGNQGSCIGTQAVARKSAGMEAMIASTDNSGNGQKATSTNGGSTAAFSSGWTTPTDGGSLGALTATVFNQGLQDAWSDGGDARVVLVGPTYKQTIDGFTSQATRFVDVGKSDDIPILTSAGVYVSDYGMHSLVLHRYIRNANPGVVLMIDPDFWATAYLRRPFMKPLADTGDSERRMLITEFCLVGRNPDSSAKVSGLT